MCIKVGLKAGQQKSMNYSKVSTFSQGPDENTTIFLEKLREALIKYTNLDLESCEGKVILKDKFLTQFSSDIRRKCQKLIQEPEVSLNEMLTRANPGFYTQVRKARAQ